MRNPFRRLATRLDHIAGARIADVTIMPAPVPRIHPAVTSTTAAGHTTTLDEHAGHATITDLRPRQKWCSRCSARAVKCYPAPGRGDAPVLFCPSCAPIGVPGTRAGSRASGSDGVA